MQKYIFSILFLLVCNTRTDAQQKYAGYLFAHMTANDYGHLYYSVSTDGLKWELLNDGKRVHEAYRGHPDISKGHDGRYYMIGVEENTGELPLWVSSDLVEWKEDRRLPKEMFNGTYTPGYLDNIKWYGAPKMFYDATTKQYLITWHAHAVDVPREQVEKYWCSMRTFYMLTNDFKTFTKPQRLLPYEMGTIDIIIRKEGELYYAILKDECEATAQWPTGKSVRVAVSRYLTGPYSYPGPSASPNYHEAPTVIPKPDGSGWYMYYEMYPGQRYGVSEAPALGGPWFGVYQMKYTVPAVARHGCMWPLTLAQYEAIVKKYKK